MTPEIYSELLDELKREPLPLAKLHGLAVQNGSRWSVDQLHLMLAVMDGVHVESGDNAQVSLGQRSESDQLVDAILDIVRSQNGRAMPAAQVLKLLPGRFTTTVEQIKRIAKDTSGLNVVGPGLIVAEH